MVLQVLREKTEKECTIKLVILIIVRALLELFSSKENKV